MEVGIGCQNSRNEELPWCQLCYRTATTMSCCYENCHCSLQWCHNGRDGVSNHQPHDCLLSCLFRRRSKKTSKLRITGRCEGNSPVTGEFPAQMSSNVKNVSTWSHYGPVMSKMALSYLFSAFMIWSNMYVYIYISCLEREWYMTMSTKFWQFNHDYTPTANMPWRTCVIVKQTQPNQRVVGGILVSLCLSVRPSFCSGVTQSQVKIIGESITLQVTKSWTIPGACPTKHISIEFEIRRKFRTPYVRIYSTDHNDILHTSRQWHCRDECKISLWSATYILHKNVLNFHRISNSIEICLVGRAPEQAWIKWSTFADVWWQFHFCRHFQMCFCE